MSYQKENKPAPGFKCIPQNCPTEHYPAKSCPPQNRPSFVGTYSSKYRVYNDCGSYIMRKVCACCGHEYDDTRHCACPECGTPVDVAEMDSEMCCCETDDIDCMDHPKTCNDYGHSDRSLTRQGFASNSYWQDDRFRRRPRFGFFPFFFLFPFLFRRFF